MMIRVMLLIMVILLIKVIVLRILLKIREKIMKLQGSQIPEEQFMILIKMRKKLEVGKNGCMHSLV